MNILLKSALAAVVCVSVTACQKELPSVVTPATTEVGGNFGKHFELVDMEYKFPTISSGMPVKLKRVTSEYDFKQTEKETGTMAGIGYEFYDEDGNVIVSQEAVLEPITPMEWGSVFPAEQGETVTKYVYLKDWPEAYRGAKTFKLIMVCDEFEDTGN